MLFKRSVQKVQPYFYETKAGEFACRKECKIIIPARWPDVNLANIGITTFSYGFFPLILSDTNEYMVCNAPVMIELKPYQTKPIKIDDEDYIEFSFEANSVVFKTLSVIKKRTIIYDILSELVLKGKVPWYASYEDMATLFRHAKKYADSDAANADAVTELIASIIARSPTNIKQYLRQTLPNVKGGDVGKVEYVALSSVVNSVNNTVNKIAGSYFSDGVQSALVHPSKNAERIETVLRT